jgi:hypothetical protein
MSAVLEKEFKYFIDHQDELVEKYNHRFLVIVGETVVGDYDSQEQAYFETVKRYELGTFLIQECGEGEDVYTETFHTGVIFA